MNTSISLIKTKNLYYINEQNKINKIRKDQFYKYLKLLYILILYLLASLFWIERKKKPYYHINSEKWIIMTTNNIQNTSYYSIFESLSDWKTVIISLNEINDNIWHKFNSSYNLVYLSIKDQLKLFYDIIKYIPISSYSRKNIGYLFAIEHGAKEIFEIDENIIIKNSNYILIIFLKKHFMKELLCAKIIKAK